MDHYYSNIISALIFAQTRPGPCAQFIKSLNLLCKNGTAIVVFMKLYYIVYRRNNKQIKTE